jgi:hypothetical protein
VNQVTGRHAQVSVYPNPVKDILNVECLVLNENTSVEIYNMIGERVHHQIITSPNCQINVADLCNGIYQLRVLKNNTSVYQTKISKVD